MVYDIRPMPLLKQYQAWDAINISPDNPFMTMRAYLQSCISLQCEEETTLLLLSIAIWGLEPYHWSLLS